MFSPKLSSDFLKKLKKTSST